MGLRIVKRKNALREGSAGDVTCCDRLGAKPRLGRQ